MSLLCLLFIVLDRKMQFVRLLYSLLLRFGGYFRHLFKFNRNTISNVMQISFILISLSSWFFSLVTSTLRLRRFFRNFLVQLLKVLTCFLFSSYECRFSKIMRFFNNVSPLKIRLFQIISIIFSSFNKRINESFSVFPTFCPAWGKKPKYK